MNSTNKNREKGYEALSQEESIIDSLIAKIENSDNPTLDLSILMEQANSHAAKTLSKSQRGKSLTTGHYSLSDNIRIPIIRQKVFQSKLTDDQKLVLLHISGDKQPGKAMSEYYVAQREALNLNFSATKTEQSNNNSKSL